MKTLTIEDLLIDPKSVEITLGKRSLTVYVRPLTQVEQDLARGSARRASRELRQMLDDPTSESHQLLVKDELEEYTPESLRNLWIANRLVERAVEANRQSLEDRDKTFVPEPEDNATSADIDHYETEVEQIEEQREESVGKKILNIKAQLEKEADELSDLQLRADAVGALIDQICAQTFSREFAVQLVTRGTFNDVDCQHPTFKYSSQVKRLRNETLETLANAHYSLLIDPEEIKN